MDDMKVSVTVNGKERTAYVAPRMLLSDFLRHTLELTGTHVGCEHGVCGSCSVMVNGVATRACLMFAVQANGAEIGTIEGMGVGGKMHPLQESFWEEHGLQCGFCTPGMLMVAKDLIAHNPDPTDDEIRDAIAGNLCRCTGYEFIINAVRSAAAKMRGETPVPSHSHHVSEAVTA